MAVCRAVNEEHPALGRPPNIPMMLVWRLHGAFNQYCITKNSNDHHHHHQGVARGGGGALLWRLTLVNAQWSWEENREFQVCESLRWNWRISLVFFRFLDLTFYETSYIGFCWVGGYFTIGKPNTLPVHHFQYYRKFPLTTSKLQKTTKIQLQW